MNFFMLLRLYQYKFGYDTQMFCKTVRKGDKVMNSIAIVHILLTPDSSARDNKHL